MWNNENNGFPFNQSPQNPQEDMEDDFLANLQQQFMQPDDPPPIAPAPRPQQQPPMQPPVGQGQPLPQQPVPQFQQPPQQQFQPQQPLQQPLQQQPPQQQFQPQQQQPLPQMNFEQEWQVQQAPPTPTAPPAQQPSKGKKALQLRKTQKTPEQQDESTKGVGFHIIADVLVAFSIVGALIGVLLFTMSKTVNVSILGYRYLVVESTDMGTTPEDSVPAGSVLFVREVIPGDITGSSVIAYYTDEAKQAYAVHRVSTVYKNLENSGEFNFEVQADIRDNPEEGMVNQEAVIGMAFYRMPKLGDVLLRINTYIWFIIAGVVLLIILSVWLRSMAKNTDSTADPKKEEKAAKKAKIKKA